MKKHNFFLTQTDDTVLKSHEKEQIYYIYRFFFCMTGTEKRDGERLVGGLVCFCKEKKKKKKRSEKEFSLECIPATAFITEETRKATRNHSTPCSEASKHVIF